MPFGQIVIGPPGSGKTTYCNGLQQFLNVTGRKVSVVNLDPANDFLPYNCSVNIADLITLEDVMREFDLGPNGGIMYCMEFLEKNLDWLENKLKSLGGQVELFTHHNSVKNIIERLGKLSYRLVTVHLVDAHHCTDPAKYISVLLLSLKTMLQIELPHINVLSKIDLMESYGKLAFNLDFYTEVQDLSYLLYHLDEDPFAKRYKELNKTLCDLIEDFGIVGFQTLCIEDKKSVMNLVGAIDKANGYIFGGLTQGNESIMLATANNDQTFYNVSDVQERWLDYKEQWDEWESRNQQEALKEAANQAP